MGSVLSKPKTPALPEPKEIPDPNDALAMQRKRQDAARRIATAGGRESTMQFSTGTGNKPVGM